MKKCLLLTLFALIVIADAQSQGLNLVGRFNRSFGFEYNSLDYAGQEILYSGGGGSGLEVGLQAPLGNDFFLQTTLGYHQNLAFQIQTGSSGSYQSSVSFNRKFLTAGIYKYIHFSDKMVSGMTLNTGLSYNLPGALKRVENENDLGKVRYNGNFGFYLEAGLRIQISESISLEPGLRYRNLGFAARSYSNGPVENLPVKLQDLNADGIELSITFVKMLNLQNRESRPGN